MEARKSGVRLPKLPFRFTKRELRAPKTARGLRETAVGALERARGTPASSFWLGHSDFRVPAPGVTLPRMLRRIALACALTGVLVPAPAQTAAQPDDQPRQVMRSLERQTFIARLEQHPELPLLWIAFGNVDSDGDLTGSWRVAAGTEHPLANEQLSLVATPSDAGSVGIDLDPVGQDGEVKLFVWKRGDVLHAVWRQHRLGPVPGIKAQGLHLVRKPVRMVLFHFVWGG